ncbi:MAG: sulfatase [Gemmatimonadota bacterium]
MAPTVALVLLFTGLAGSVGEAAVILSARAVLERYTLFNPQGLWLAPIATALVALVPVVVAWLVGRRRGSATAFAFALGAGVGVASLEPLLVLKDRLHLVALAVLATAIGVQTARLSWSRPVLAHKLVRWTAAVLALFSLAGAAWFNIGRAWRESRPVAGAAPAGAPNVILLVLDTVRALSLSAYGHHRPTSPFLAGLAAQGVRFDRAISTAPWTLPSHVSLFTGRFPSETSAEWSVPLDAEHRTIAEVLSESGYATAGVAANLRYCSYEFGVTRGFRYYRDYDVSLSEMLRSSSLSRELIMAGARRVDAEPGLGRQFADRINERFLAWIDDRPRERPFFAFLNYYDAHGPYAPPAPYDTLFLGRRPVVRDPGLDSYTPVELQELEAGYDASIAYLDERLRELFGALDSRGVLENTIVIVTSDHGEEFNEHGVMNHGSSLYFPSVHIPLMVVWPGRIPSGSVVTTPVTLRDVPATILDLIGGPVRGALPGSSLALQWTNDGTPAASPRLAELDWARNLPSGPIGHGDMKSVADDSGLRYIRRGDGHEELYNVVADPLEARNLAGDSSFVAAVSRLRSTVDSVSASPRPRRR